MALKRNMYPLEHRQDWRRWVTPKPLANKPIHRWCIFPHSFTSELVHALVDEWSLTPKDRILDPFAGAGTTLLAAKEKNIPASGYDILPLAVFGSKVKVSNYQTKRLLRLWKTLLNRYRPSSGRETRKDYPTLVRKALPGKLLCDFEALDHAVMKLKAECIERDFFRLALISTIPAFSLAVASGGWLRWKDRQNSSSTMEHEFAERVELMLEDLISTKLPNISGWNVELADARSLPDGEATYEAVITSPPYPNRHDYTRVFGVELMFAFLNWEETRQIRYQSFHSHPESRPVRPELNDYRQPSKLRNTISNLNSTKVDSRIPNMIEGYFKDLYVMLKEIKRVSKKGAKIAIVVGNAQYGGQPVPVDELTAEIGEYIGLKCQKLVVARYRGNSAQQMGKYGRRPARESVVIFTKP